MRIISVEILKIIDERERCESSERQSSEVQLRQ